MRPACAAAVTISPAAGAALAPPYPAFSITIAKAIRLVAGPYGAKPTNHPCGGLPVTSAVPVLPAMGQAWLSQAAPRAGKHDVAHVPAEPLRVAGAEKHVRVSRCRSGASSQ